MRVRVPYIVATMLLVASCTGPAASEAPPGAGASGTSLEGTSWKLAALPGTTPASGVSSTVTFGAAGMLSGSDGCNRYRGRWTASGRTLTLSPGAATQMACPEAVMKQASAFVGALVAARSYAVGAGELVLTGANGERVATLVPVPVATLTGTPWSAGMVNNGKQAVASLVQGSEITASFGADGTLSGSAGCNRYTATYTIQGDTITIAPPAATRKMCQAPLMEQERNYLTALTHAVTYHLGESSLELRSRTGAQQVSFRASP